MRITLLIGLLIYVSFSAAFVSADDCNNFDEQKICWEGDINTTLSWAYPAVTSGEYKIEMRDFNWLGSFSLRVTRNGVVKEGLLSEGELYLFNFSTNSKFEGLKVIAEKVSNVNSFPINIGTYPADPQAKISVWHSIEDTEPPALELSLLTEKETDVDSITLSIKTTNSGDYDLLDTHVAIFYDDLDVMDEFDFNDGTLTKMTSIGREIRWKNITSYKLTPSNNKIIRNGYTITLLNFSNGSVKINAEYEGSSKSELLKQDEPVVLDFTREDEYRGIRFLGLDILNDSASVMLQFPEINSLKRIYRVIPSHSDETIKLKFSMPRSSRKTYTISVIAEGKDRDGNNYTASDEDTISFENTFELRKFSSDSILNYNLYEDSSEIKNVVSVRNITKVSIFVNNLKDFPVYGLILTDTILPGFHFRGDPNRSFISWSFDMKAKEQKEFKYELSPQRQGVFTLPGADLTWKEWGESVHLQSNAPKTSVSGPYIVLERSFNRSNIAAGDALLTTLSITNNGDLPDFITVNDSVPENASFISGTLSFSGFLRPGENARIEYAVLAGISELEFKPPEMSARDQNYRWYEPLSPRKISSFSPAEAALPQKIIPMETKTYEEQPERGIIQMINEEFPWFEGSFSILSLLFGILLLIFINKKYFRIYEK